ncbi:hypothetical protein HN695_06255 [Candidatus Woesearchaeota archaeon]|jgi:hypothetical protein|nr:hypothetical protein [Candidatus Woesearchaeota archaeon]MBT5272721.1 hypothetical protein [Candidatus Woesearchaeota archaeon]MBT6040332.1 hypothetical protein [Candidatus Woesearchaeota archaeon]MBT6337034.1 hypothetical protein [Candidatus Woesearchaeota archaeon]MBT7927912.1 hypothetical protein [Candidatus Woesearchaeota archaeon]
MGFLNNIIGKPSGPGEPAPATKVEMKGPPTDRVIAMRQHGLSNNQIIQALQNEGHNSTEILDAINQADLKGGVEMSPNQSGQPVPAQMPGQPSQPPQQPPGASPAQGPGPMSPPGQPLPPGFGSPAPAMGQEAREEGPALERIEELAEAIIDEKWNEIVKSINKIAEWKERTDAKITQMEQKFEDLKHNFDTLHKGVLGKIGDYDSTLTNISSEIKAMDKVFQKVLPVMTENVNELSRITQDMKKKA